MYIDLEQIAREEIRKLITKQFCFQPQFGQQQHNPLYMKGEEKESVDSSKTETPHGPAPIPPTGVKWEYSPKPGRRRSKSEIALHEMEIKLGRNLTPEEKGETEADVELSDEAQFAAKEKAKNKARINKMAEEGMAAAKAESGKEPAKEFVNGEEVVNEKTPAQQEATGILNRTKEEQKLIPKTESLANINSLFK